MLMLIRMLPASGDDSLAVTLGVPARVSIVPRGPTAPCFIFLRRLFFISMAGAGAGMITITVATSFAKSFAMTLAAGIDTGPVNCHQVNRIRLNEAGALASLAALALAAAVRAGASFEDVGRVVAFAFVAVALVLATALDGAMHDGAYGAAPLACRSGVEGGSHVSQQLSCSSLINHNVDVECAI